MSENFLISKPVNESLFKSGFAIPSEAMEIFSFYLSGGQLAHGEKRAVAILIDGEFFEVTLRSIGFNQNKYPNRKDMWQINYGRAVGERVREIFSAGQKFFTLYPTEIKNLFYLKAEFACNEQTVENLLDLPTLTDTQAALIEKFGLTKYRKLNREIGERLKRNYNFRCQICGRSVGEFYGVNLVDCHHITPFSESLNNNAANLLIVCPNHHRIIHAANPIFDRERKLYLYPNGREEILQLNEHL